MYLNISSLYTILLQFKQNLEVYHKIQLKIILCKQGLYSAFVYSYKKDI